VIAVLLVGALLMGPAPPVAERPERTYLFHDEFNGDHLRQVWQTRGTSYELGSTVARGSHQAAIVRNGILRLRVIPDPADQTRYLNGHIGTEGRFEFDRGWAAARVRVPPFSGSHAAFWILTPTVIGDQAGHEVDVMESFGRSRPNGPGGTNVWHGVWYPDPTLPAGSPFVQEAAAANSETYGQQPWHRDFHVYAVHWTPTRYSFYIDGTRVGVIRLGLTGVPKFLILSLLTRDWEVPALLTHDLATYVMRVDWVRVWAAKGAQRLPPPAPPTIREAA